MDGAGIGTAGSENIPLNGNSLVPGTPLQCVHHFRVADHRMVHRLDAGTAAQFTSTIPGSAGGIIHVRHIHGNGIVRFYGPGRRFCAPSAHFLLNGEHEIEIVFTVSGLLQSLQKDSAG